MAELHVRLAGEADLEAVESIYAHAREFMAAGGNPTQWGTDYPPHNLLTKDLTLKRLFVVENGEGLCGAFAFMLGDEPTYAVIEDGSWEGNGPYGTIHRLAGNGSCHGVFAACLEFCQSLCTELRADTHRDNGPMRRLLEKSGFQYRGVIRVEDGTERLAFQLKGF